MKIADVRQSFLDYFEAKGHKVVPSSSLVPGNDPTLLFTNAGMVQFKDVFLGSDRRPYKRAASSQRCVRAGGKHNDLENVGYTARHHTFFEMLGNFSFGDYFKEDAIRFAWEFLTKIIKLPEDKLWVTVHVSDDEAADIWLKGIGISPDRFSRLDEDNFWQMGDTGPCGPSSEIFYDHGADVEGGSPGSENDDGDRYIEIWNLVFMQFERRQDGELVNLPNPSIDTGMGLERLAAVLQGVHSNYEVDLFQSLIAAAAKLTGTVDLTNQSLRVIADHIRSCSFLVLDGVLPSNEGRGYVLRRIIRRALRHGQKLGKSEPFFSELVDTLVEEMGEAYPGLVNNQKQVKSVLAAEEEQFARTLEKGLAVLEEEVADLKEETLPGELIFKLYDTYGFPVDLTNDIAREKGLTLDLGGYERCMEEQRKRARAASQFGGAAIPQLSNIVATDFVGYGSSEAEGQVVELLAEGQPTPELLEGQEGIVILDRTAFYAESGGQIGDCGFLEAESFKFEVVDCKKQGKVHLHVGKVLQGRVTVSDRITGRIDRDVRQAIVLNHSATHLLHAALRQVLGDHVAQQGSLVDSEKTRFDFSHPEPVRPDQLAEVEALVNEQIRFNSDATIELMAIDDAREKGAMMLFGEKYGDEVRVLSMGKAFPLSSVAALMCNEQAILVYSKSQARLALPQVCVVSKPSLEMLRLAIWRALNSASESLRIFCEQSPRI